MQIIGDKAWRNQRKDRKIREHGGSYKYLYMKIIAPSQRKRNSVHASYEDTGNKQLFIDSE